VFRQRMYAKSLPMYGCVAANVRKLHRLGAKHGWIDCRQQMSTANLEKKLRADGYVLVRLDAPIEYGRLHDLKRCFGIPRSTAYLLINEGKIRSKIVRLTHSRTGLRLIDFGSVRDFLNGAPERPTAEVSNHARRAGRTRKG
jgi:hypothetical protein